MESGEKKTVNLPCTKQILQAILNLALQKEYCSNTFENDRHINNCGDGCISKHVDLAVLGVF